LSTSFLLPPTALSYLTTSIELYRHAVTLTESTLLQLDAGFNLAEALLDLGEILEDLHPDRTDQVRKLRGEARDILEGVLSGQEDYIAANAEDLEVDQASAMADSQTIEEPAEEPAVTGEDSDMEVDEMPETGEQTETYETHVPTPSSLVDTALVLIDTHLTLWTTASPPSPPTQEQQLSVRSILDRASKHTPVGRQAEMDLAEIKVLLAMDEIVWEAFKAEAAVGTGIEKSLEGAIAALTSLLASLDIHPPEEPTLRAEILMVLADTHQTIAHRLLLLVPQLPPGPSPLAQGAWFNLSQAVTHLGKALDLPSSADTPKTFKPSVLMALSKASLARARLGGINETAKRNAAQLIDNASTYAVRAAEALGWGSYIKASVFGAPAPPYPSGWDTEWLARSVVLQYLRIAYVTTTTDIVPEAKDKFASALKTTVERLKALQGERKMQSADVERWVEEVKDEESMEEAESSWWKGIAETLAK